MASAACKCINVYAASISGDTLEAKARDTFLRFCGTGPDSEHGSIDRPSAGSSWDPGRFEDFAFELSRRDAFIHGDEVIPCAGWGTRGPSTIGIFGVFTGVHPPYIGDPGYDEYISVRSVSVPYPLSTSMPLNFLGRCDFGGGQIGSSEKAEDCLGLLANDDSLDCS